jgi:hypothetical protein
MPITIASKNIYAVTFAQTAETAGERSKADFFK